MIDATSSCCSAPLDNILVSHLMMLIVLIDVYLFYDGEYLSVCLYRMCAVGGWDAMLFSCDFGWRWWGAWEWGLHPRTEEVMLITTAGEGVHCLVHFTVYCSISIVQSLLLCGGHIPCRDVTQYLLSHLWHVVLQPSSSLVVTQ